MGFLEDMKSFDGEVEALARRLLGLQIECMLIQHAGVMCEQRGEADQGRLYLEVAADMRESLASTFSTMRDSFGSDEVDRSFRRIRRDKILLTSLSDVALASNAAFFDDLPSRPPGAEYECDEAQFAQAVEAVIAEYFTDDDDDEDAERFDPGDLALDQVAAAALRVAAAQVPPGQSLTTGRALAALVRVNAANDWHRVWLHSGEPGQLGLADAPDTPDEPSPWSWAGVPLSAAMARSLALLQRLCRSYDLAPAAPGLLALATVAFPGNGAASVLTAHGLEHARLLDIVQGDLIGTHLEGLADLLASQPVIGPGATEEDEPADETEPADEDTGLPAYNSVADLGALTVVLVEQEALVIHRALVAIDPARFGAGLAASLCNASGSLYRMDRVAEALPYAQEAVTIMAGLVTQNPSYRPLHDRYLSHLATLRLASGDT